MGRLIQLAYPEASGYFKEQLVVVIHRRTKVNGISKEFETDTYQKE